MTSSETMSWCTSCNQGILSGPNNSANSAATFSSSSSCDVGILSNRLYTLNIKEEGVDTRDGTSAMIPSNVLALQTEASQTEILLKAASV